MIRDSHHHSWNLPFAIMLASVVGIGADSIPAVNFHYAFAPPHRITVAMPDSSNKTLLDALSGKLMMSWTYENLVHDSFNSFLTPATRWKVNIEPQIDGHPFAHSNWERVGGHLPALKNTYHDDGTDMGLEIAGGATAAIGKITLANSSAHTPRLTTSWPDGTRPLTRSSSWGSAPMNTP